jgi:hypothetical protein
MRYSVKYAAAAGTNQRYDAQTNINKFNGDQQMSFIGMGNNTNKQGFSISDILNFSGDMSRSMRSGGGGITINMGGGGDNNGLPVSGAGQNAQGVATTFAGGINYNDTWNNRKTDFICKWYGKQYRSAYRSCIQSALYYTGQ